MADDDARRKLVQYDPTIHLGHILTIATIIIAGFGWALQISRNDARQDALIEAQSAQYQHIQTLLMRIDEKLDRKMDKR